MHFSSDNTSGAVPEIMDALADANHGNAASYGADDWTQQLTARLSAVFECPVAAFPVMTGTAANAIALGAYARPGGLVLTYRNSHIVLDECGAPNLLSGGLRTVDLPAPFGKLQPQTVAERIEDYTGRGVNAGRLVALSLTNLNEYGKAYAPDEVRALSVIAHAGGLAVHMDGARFANAVAKLGCSPADITWKAGVDVLTLGGTKNGCWCAETIIFFNPEQAVDVPFLAKRSGHVVSKTRFISAQMLAYLEDGLWLRLAAHANAQAAALAKGVSSLPGVRLVTPPDGNEVFLIWPKTVGRHMEEKGATFYRWNKFAAPQEAMSGKEEEIARLVTSFSTSDEQVVDFLTALKSA